MSIQVQVQRLENAKAELAAAIQEGGVDIPAGASIDQYAGLVRQVRTQIPASAVVELEGTDYTTNRVRGISLQATEPGSVPNGCIVGVYE